MSSPSDYWTTATYTNVSITGNSAVADSPTDGVSAVVFGFQSVDSTFVNADVSDNTIRLTSGTSATFVSTTGAGGYAWSHSNLEDATFSENLTDPVGADGNISVDPGYADGTATSEVDWDLSLSSTSALIDAGDSSILDPDGTTSDIGAWGGPGAADW
jgi:hypothetical protein